MKEIPLLTANDVELRAAQVNKTQYGTYITLLVYKDARVDMRVLDETYGAMNWQRHHCMIGNNLYCTISVYDEQKKCWIEKQDVGVESYTEADKGRASDSFKRAGFNFGIGRELYNAPHIRFKLNDDEVVEKNNKVTTYAKFRVAKMVYDKEQQAFTVFDVVDKNGCERFSLNSNKRPERKEETSKEPKITMCGECVRFLDDKQCQVLSNNGKWYNVEQLPTKNINELLISQDYVAAHDALRTVLNVRGV